MKARRFACGKADTVSINDAPGAGLPGHAKRRSRLQAEAAFQCGITPKNFRAVSPWNCPADAKAATAAKGRGFWRKPRFLQNDALKQGVFQKQNAPGLINFENACSQNLRHARSSV